MIGMLRTPADSRWYHRSLLALIGGAWVVLAEWGASPYAWLLDHDAIGAGELPALLRLPVFVVGWTLMTVAMMLPGSLPLVNLFRRMIAPRADRKGLELRLLLGYLAIWSLFGLLAYLGDFGLHRLVASSATAASVAAAGGIAAAVVLLAGVYQFTPLKRMCLEQCRSPYSFLAGHWRGTHPGRDALRLGLRHGLFCLGCCWSLMLLMFALAGLNLAWMLALGAAMAAERSSARGRQLTRPLGVVLIACAPLFLILPALR
jgi:predicted metal-binding membrane protein